MAALAADRAYDIKDRGRSIRLKVQAAVKIYLGALVAVEATGGFAVPAADTANYRVIGVCDIPADNTAGAAGALICRVTKGCVKFVNGDSIAQVDIGKTAYASDDQTVKKATATNSVVVGVIDSIDPDDGGIWVYIA